MNDPTPHPPPGPPGATPPNPAPPAPPAAIAAAGAGTPSAPASEGDLQSRVVAALRTVFDPEIPVNIYDMGMIYQVGVKDDASVDVRMTLTSPSCPVAGSLPPEVQAKLAALPGVAAARVELVWEPPWNPEMMSEAAKLQLNMM